MSTNIVKRNKTIYIEQHYYINGNPFSDVIYTIKFKERTHKLTGRSFYNYINKMVSEKII